MQDQANKYTRDVTYTGGDMVYLKLQPYKHISIAKKTNEKLNPRFYGPYKILKKIGVVSYKLELPSNARILPLFHVTS